MRAGKHFREWACIIGSALGPVGCSEDTDSCIDRAYDVQVGEVLSLPSWTRPHDNPPVELGEGWAFGVQPTGRQLLDHEDACHSVHALYDPPPDEVTLGSFRGGNVEGGGVVYRYAARLEGAMVEFRGCSGGLSALLLTPSGSDKVETARGAAEQGGDPLALSLCFSPDGGVSPDAQDAASCDTLREDLSSSHGSGCILRAVQLTPRP